MTTKELRALIANERLNLSYKPVRRARQEVMLAELTRWAEARELLADVGDSIRSRVENCECQSKLMKLCVAISMETPHVAPQ